MNDRVLAVMGGGWCLLWFAAAVAPAFPGRRRWRWGRPGGRRAVAAAVCGAALPAFLVGLCTVRGVWADEPPIWKHPAFAVRFHVGAIVLVTAWIASLGLLVWAGTTSAATTAAPERSEGGGPR